MAARLVMRRYIDDNVIGFIAIFFIKICPLGNVEGYVGFPDRAVRTPVARRPYRDPLSNAKFAGRSGGGLESYHNR